MTAALKKKAIRRAPAPREDDEPDERVLLPDDDEFTPDDVAVAELLEELGGTDAEVRIYRQGASARDLELLDTVPVSSFDPMMLAVPPYNGGQFRIHARSAGGLKVNRLLKVARKFVPVDPNATPAMVGQAPAQGLTLDQIVAAVKAAMPVAPAPTSRKEILEEMQMMSAIMNPPGRVQPGAVAGSDGVKEQFGLMREMFNFAKGVATGTVGGDDKAEPDYLGMGVRLLEGAMATRKGVPGAVGDVPALPAPENNGAANAAPPAENPAQPVQISEGDMRLKILVEYALNKACDAAEAGEDAREYAEDIFDDIPADVLGDMRARHDWFERLCAMVPDCAKFKPWFEQVRAALLWLADNPEKGVDDMPAASSAPATPSGGNLTGAGNSGSVPINSTPPVGSGAENGATVRTTATGGKPAP